MSGKKTGFLSIVARLWMHHFHFKPVPYLQNGIKGEREFGAGLMITKSSSESQIQLNLVYIWDDEIKIAMVNIHGNQT